MLNHTEALLGYLAEAWANHLLGSDPFEIESLVHRMTRHDYARAGEIAMSALAIVEIETVSFNLFAEGWERRQAQA